jgi:poly-beta-1,6-N-acetyl-D-glucosamine synthase
MTVLEWIFWANAGLVVYGMVGYPIVAWLLGRLVPRPLPTGGGTPPVTCVVAVRDEVEALDARLQNLLSLDYPSDRLDVVVVSDGSFPALVHVAQRWIDRCPERVRLVALATPRGKAVALNEGVRAASREIVVFADVRQRFELKAVRMLVRNFADPAVGAVSGELVLASDEAGVQNGLAFYWRLEKLLRKAEGRRGWMIGCTGAIYAIRRRLFQPLPPETLLDDVLLPIRIALDGYRVVFEAEARAIDRLGAAPQEFARKVRTTAGNLQLLRLCPALANPLRGAVAWRFLSHKIVPRVLTPYSLLVLLLTSFALSHPVYRAALVGQLLMYGLGIVGLLTAPRGGAAVAYPAAFLLLNVAGFVGAARYASGTTNNLWRHGNANAVSASTPQPIPLRAMKGKRQS